jgi:aspartate 1-decarboxylase
VENSGEAFGVLAAARLGPVGEIVIVCSLATCCHTERVRQYLAENAKFFSHLVLPYKMGNLGNQTLV